MATSNVYRVDYQIVKVGAYTREIRSAHVSCAAPGSIANVLGSNVSLAAGESIAVVCYEQETSTDGVIYS